jgi:hypothetical protein
MKKLILGVVGVLILLIVVLLFQSAPIDPAPYTPPKAPELTGEPLCANDDETPTPVKLL